MLGLCKRPTDGFGRNINKFELNDAIFHNKICSRTRYEKEHMESLEYRSLRNIYKCELNGATLRNKIHFKIRYENKHRLPG